MEYNPLTAVSSIDGRYHEISAGLSEYFSEYGLIKQRLAVECEYLIALSETKGVGMRTLTAEEKATLRYRIFPLKTRKRSNKQRKRPIMT